MLQQDCTLNSFRFNLKKYFLYLPLKGEGFFFSEHLIPEVVQIFLQCCVTYVSISSFSDRFELMFMCMCI